MTVRITTLTELSLYLIRPEDKEERVAEVAVDAGILNEVTKDVRNIVRPPDKGEH